MFIKKGEERECWLQCSRSELLDEFLFQVSAVVERIGHDANLLAYDVAIEAIDVIDAAARAGSNAKNAYYSAVYSVARVPQVSAAMLSAVLIR